MNSVRGMAGRGPEEPPLITTTGQLASVYHSPLPGSLVAGPQRHPGGFELNTLVLQGEERPQS